MPPLPLSVRRTTGALVLTGLGDWSWRLVFAVNLPLGIVALALLFWKVPQDKPDAEGLVRCHLQASPARQLPNLQKMPILVVMGEASYHAPYDHCTVKYLEQAGARPTFMKLGDLGIRGNSHVLMLEKNSRDIALAITRWLARSVPPAASPVNRAQAG